MRSCRRHLRTTTSSPASRRSSTTSRRTSPAPHLRGSTSTSPTTTTSRRSAALAPKSRSTACAIANRSTESSRRTSRCPAGPPDAETPAGSRQSDGLDPGGSPAGCLRPAPLVDPVWPALGLQPRRGVPLRSSGGPHVRRLVQPELLREPTRPHVPALRRLPTALPQRRLPPRVRREPERGIRDGARGRGADRHGVGRARVLGGCALVRPPRRAAGGGPDRV